MARLASARAGKSSGLFGGSLMPLMLMGGGSDNLRNFMMYRMLMGGMGGGADPSGATGGSNMLFPMLMMTEGGIF